MSDQAEAYTPGIRSVADSIAAAVDGLRAHREARGSDEAAYNPNDAETNEKFQSLWHACRHWTIGGPQQERVIGALGHYHDGVIQTMRTISNASEVQMEKGHVKHAIAEARKLTSDPPFEGTVNEFIAANFSDDDVFRFPGSPEDQSRDSSVYLSMLVKLAACNNPALRRPQDPENETLGECMERLLGVANTVRCHLEDTQAPEEQVMRARRDYECVNRAVGDVINAMAEQYEDITESYPYKTYKALAAHEAFLPASLKGIDMRTQVHGTYLIVEAGPLPETAIFHSMIHYGSRVICTNKDPETCEQSRELIHELERLKLLEPGRVQVIQADPLSEEFRTMKFHDEAGREVKPYAALITQLVQPASKVKQIADVLIEDHHIDTLVTRGADGLSKLLYEPLDDLQLASGLKLRNTVVPSFAEAGEMDRARADHTAHAYHMTYNTSHCFSTRERDMQKARPDEDTILFDEPRSRGILLA